MFKKLKEIQTTKTTDFLLPLLGKSKPWYAPYLVNAYLDNSSFPKKRENSIHILLKFSGDKRFAEIEKEIMSWEEYVDSYDLIKGHFIMYVVDIPEILLEDYSLILKGKYSEISLLSKSLLLKGRGAKSPMPFILNKDDILKNHWERELDANLGDLDVWPIFNIEKEIFDIEEFPIKASVLR